jgi:hypothetical protein
LEETRALHAMERSRREKKSNVDIAALYALSAAKRGVESRKDQVRVGMDMGTERRAVDWDIEGHLCIGGRLVKLFDGVSYLGQVVGWTQPSASTHRWLVVYNDGDKEEMEQEELASAVLLKVSHSILPHRILHPLYLIPLIYMFANSCRRHSTPCSVPNALSAKVRSSRSALRKCRRRWRCESRSG